MAAADQRPVNEPGPYPYSKVSQNETDKQPNQPSAYTAIELLNTVDNEAPPPSYESLYGQLRQVRSPRGFTDFARRACGVIDNVICVLMMVLFTLVPIAMIVIGSYYLKDCREERYIPIYLIVGGVFPTLLSLKSFYYRIQKRRRNLPESPEGENQAPQSKADDASDTVEGCIYIFLFAWFIAGSVWVFRAKPVFNDPYSSHYCDPVVYYFGLVLIAVTYCFLAAIVFILCPFVVWACSTDTETGTAAGGPNQYSTPQPTAPPLDLESEKCV